MIQPKLGKPYFIDLSFKTFSEQVCCVFHESLLDVMKYNPPTWFVTVDPDPYKDYDCYQVLNSLNALQRSELKAAPVYEDAIKLIYELIERRKKL